MITELTEEQKKMIPVYVEKWAKIGLSCEPVKDYEETISLFYEKILNRKRPAKIILSPSPQQTCEQLLEHIRWPWDQVREQLKQVEDLLWKQVRKQVLEQVLKQVRRLTEKQPREELWENISRRLPDIVTRRTAKMFQTVDVEDMLGVLMWRYPFGYNAFAFYDYFNQVLGIQYSENWFIFKRTTELGIVYPFVDACIVLDRPEQITMKNGVLHNETGMAIKYRDGWGIYMLNGVKVTKKIVETSAGKLYPEIILKETDARVRLEIVKKMEADKLNPEILLKETNAEVRREIVRKIGVERLEKKLKPLALDRWGDYELHDYSQFFPRMRCKPVYLKMKNPSIGVWHYEGVNIDEMSAPTCKAALEWRLKGKEFKPKQIT